MPQHSTLLTEYSRHSSCLKYSLRNAMFVSVAGCLLKNAEELSDRAFTWTLGLGFWCLLGAGDQDRAGRRLLGPAIHSSPCLTSESRTFGTSLWNRQCCCNWQQQQTSKVTHLLTGLWDCLALTFSISFITALANLTLYFLLYLYKKSVFPWVITLWRILLHWPSWLGADFSSLKSSKMLAALGYFGRLEEEYSANKHFGNWFI